MIREVDYFGINERLIDFARNTCNDTVTFLQIGSGDGVTHDPLYQFIVTYNWSGILIEPVPYQFEQLRANYKYEDLNLELYNIAVAKEYKSETFYYLKENGDRLPYWYNQLGSTDKNLILSHKNIIPQIDKYITSIELEFVTLESILSKSKFKTFDVLHIDAEGQDMDILNYINIENLGVRCLLFEHKHTSKQPVQSYCKYLEKIGYELFQNTEDTLAILDC